MIEYKTVKITSSLEDLGYYLTHQDGWEYAEILDKRETWIMDRYGNKQYELIILLRKNK